MPFNVQFTQMPAGYLLEVHQDGRAEVLVREFTSSEDGDLFISRLEGIPSQIIGLLPSDAGIQPSTIDHLLAIIHRDKTATIYVNELSMVTKARIKRRIEVGDPVFKSDIADIEVFEFEGVTVPEDTGIVVILSDGWRKALYFDLAMLHTPYSKRQYDLWELLGHFYAYWAYQQYFRISDSEWEQLLKEKWFPFITLNQKTIREMLSHARSGSPIDEILETIAEDVNQALDQMLARWAANNVMKPHIQHLETSIERYRNGDYISSTTILYTRIEGMMRAVNDLTPSPLKATQTNLASAFLNVNQNIGNRYSLLLPHKFKEYIEQVYFAAFVPGQPAPLSRNSVGHGVAASQDFSLKAATIGLLIVDQIFFLMPPIATPE